MPFGHSPDYADFVCLNRGLRGLRQINGMNAIWAFPGLRGFCLSESRITPNQRYECRLGIPRITRITRIFWFVSSCVLFF